MISFFFIKGFSICLFYFHHSSQLSGTAPFRGKSLTSVNGIKPLMTEIPTEPSEHPTTGASAFPQSTVFTECSWRGGGFFLPLALPWKPRVSMNPSVHQFFLLVTIQRIHFCFSYSSSRSLSGIKCTSWSQGSGDREGRQARAHAGGFNIRSHWGLQIFEERFNTFVLLMTAVVFNTFQRKPPSPRPPPLGPPGALATPPLTSLPLQPAHSCFTSFILIQTHSILVFHVW